MVFRERQYFRQWWIWLMLVGFAVFLGYLILSSLWQEGIDEKNNITHVQLLIAVTGMVSVIAIFALSHLDSRIDEDGVHYKFTPFHFRTRTLKWDEISRACVRKYNPLLEYGGWGIRITGFFGKGRAFNVSGNMGLQLELKNGKKILLGTNKPDELTEALKHFIKN